jgi:2',3'-cyclic-nucleotide 2'-phosphodiesterase/3'-nucleotidase
MIKLKNIKYLLICIVFFFVSKSIYSQNITIKIIETSDVHGAIFPYNFVADKDSRNSLAQVHAYVEQQRAVDGQEVILVDNGDILQGDPAVYYYNYEKPEVLHLYARVMNYMNYDVGTVGNHDIETGHPVYDKFTNELNFPWLAANAVNTETGKPYFQPYFIINKSGVKIAVLGLITPGIPKWLPKKIWEGIEFEDMILTAKKWVPIIMEVEKPDLLIGLFHAGIDYTYDNQTAETPRNENAAQLVAEQVPGFDIVFVGHDHHEWNKTVKDKNGKEVLILGPQSRAQGITEAVIDLSYDDKTQSWDKKITGEIISMKPIEPDEQFLKQFESEFKEIKDYVSRPIGIFTKTISAKESIFGNSAFVDLIHNIQLELTEADISITAPLSIYAEIDSGNVYVRDMFNLYRYENLLYTMELSGKEVKDFLEFSYSLWFNQMKSENDNMLLFVRDEEGRLVWSKRTKAAMLKNRYYNFDSAEGIEYVVRLDKPIGEKVVIVSMGDGSKFDEEKKYKVAINSYRGNGGGGHLTEGVKIPQDKLAERVVNSTEKDLRYYMMKWIEKQGTVNPNQIVNWKLIPENWWKEAREKDYKLMFKGN